MFFHIIFFKFSSRLTENQICRTLNALGKLRESIPQIKSYSFGRNDSDNEHNNGFEYCFVMSFDTKNDRQIYQQHPLHQDFIKKHIDQFLDGAIVFDFKEIDEF